MSGLTERSKRQIALLAGDDLEVSQAEETRRSVASCPHCRGHWLRVRDCLDALGRTGKEPVPSPEISLWPSIESRLAPARAPRSERFNGWVPALSMAAACIALLIAGQMEAAPPQDFIDPAGSISPAVALNPDLWSPTGDAEPGPQGGFDRSYPGVASPLDGSLGRDLDSDPMALLHYQLFGEWPSRLGSEIE